MKNKLTVFLLPVLLTVAIFFFFPLGAGMAQQGPQKAETEGLPLDKFGQVNWVALVEKGLIKPKWSIDPEADADDEETEEINIFFESRSPTMEDVLFSHTVHTFWLNCESCHETQGGEIFLQEADPSVRMRPMESEKKWCGRCHGSVAFSMKDCDRCHNLKKGAPKDEEWTIREFE